MQGWGRRIRIFVSSNAVALAAVLILVGALGLWLTYTTHAAPQTVTEQTTQGGWESTAEYTHSATVTEPNPVYETGHTLENRSTYYRTIAPILDGTFRYGFDADDGQLGVELESWLVIRSVTDEGEVLWQTRESLGDEASILTPGEAATHSFTLNVSDIHQRVQSIEDELGSSPGETEVLVRTSVDAEGTAEDESAEHSATYEMEISSDEDTYSISTERHAEQHPRVEQVSRPVQYGPLRTIGGPLLLLLGLVGSVGLGVGTVSGRLRLSSEEREMMSFADQRAEFDDWISRGTVPVEATERPTVQMETLEGLVDVAVDTDERVIEDFDKERYFVLDEVTCYEYQPPDGVDPSDLQPIE